MTGLPPPPPPPRDPGDVDEWYRRVSSSDRIGPSERVRQAVLDHATKIAAARASEASPASAGGRRWGRPGWRGPAVAGTLAAALAALMLLPRVLPPSADETGVRARTAPAPRAQAAPAAQTAPLAQAAPPAQAALPPQGASRPGAPSRYMEAEAAKSARSDARSAINAPSVAAARESSFARQSLAEAAQTQPLRANARSSEGTAQQTAAALRYAAQIGDLAALETLLQRHVDIDSRDSLGRTALMLATLHGQIGTATALLDDGADPNAADVRGTTPLQAARAADHPDIAAALKRYGAR